MGEMKMKVLFLLWSHMLCRWNCQDLMKLHVRQEIFGLNSTHLAHAYFTQIFFSICDSQVTSSETPFSSSGVVTFVRKKMLSREQE